MKPRKPIIVFSILAGALALFVAGCATAPKPEKAEKKAESLPPEEDLYSGVAYALSLGDPKKAIADLEAAEKRNPESTETKYLLSQVLLMANRTDEAAKLLEEVLVKEPGNADALYALSLAEGARGNAARQKALLKKILEIDPANGKAQASLGELFLREKKYAEAEAAFGKSLQTDAGNLVALIGKGNVELRQGKAKEAEITLTKAIEAEPSYSFAYVDRSKAKTELGDLEGAEKDVTKAITIDPEYGWNYYDRGKVFVNQGKAEEALKDFTRAVELEPELFLAYVYRARIYDGKGDFEKAEVDFRKALSLRPDYPFLSQPLGLLAYQAGRWKEAAGFFKKAYDFDDKELAYPLLAALCYKNAGDEKTAGDYLQGCLDAFPRDSLFYHMARFYLLPASDLFIVQQVNQEKNKSLKARMLFYLAAQYKLQDKGSLARRYFLEASEAKTSGFIENRLAGWEMKRVKDR